MSMNTARVIYALTLGALLLACRGPDAKEHSGPYVASVCSEEMFEYPMIAIRQPDETINLVQGGECGLACGCGGNLASGCGWKLTNVEAAPGIREHVPSDCFECEGGDGSEEGGVEGWSENTGTLEIVRIDDNGVVGCVLDSCVGDFRFEAAWCP